MRRLKNIDIYSKVLTKDEKYDFDNFNSDLRDYIPELVKYIRYLNNLFDDGEKMFIPKHFLTRVRTI